MTLDLRALLSESEPSAQPVTHPIAAAPAPLDPLADKPLHLSLTLSPSPTLATRQIQGTVGEPGQMPLFIQEPVTVAEFGRMLETLYAAYAEMAAARSEADASQKNNSVSGAGDSAENQGQLLATGDAAQPPAALDIF